jgi:L-lactate dehydrogenase complex protein LldF
VTAPAAPLAERARLAVANAKLQAALWRATGRLLDNRDRAFAALSDGDARRDAAREARLRALRTLDQQLERFVASCVKNGIQVHWARDAEEANQLVVELARGRGSVIKSKSMATEETELNAALEASGLEVVETDLGEWVVQLAKERPSHIVAPSLHKTKDEFAELIGQQLGRAVPAEHETLVKAARERLRREFVRSGVGISGVNFGVAETGTLVLVTNEGNGRLVTSGPAVHIALMGIEKVVATLDDAAALLRVLARSGTGQKMTSYVSFISGPRRADELDGPDEVHVVLLDNGRSTYLGNEMWESLLCIRCGACLNTCPVYRRIGGHAYGSTYPGPIGLLATPMIQPDDPEVRADLPHASSLCGACHEICPVRIDLPRMILALRARAITERHAAATERWIFRLAAFALARPALYRLLLFLGALVTRIVGTRALPFFGRWTKTRDLPPVAPTSFQTWWKRRPRPS